VGREKNGPQKKVFLVSTPKGGKKGKPGALPTARQVHNTGTFSSGFKDCGGGKNFWGGWKKEIGHSVWGLKGD